MRSITLRKEMHGIRDNAKSKGNSPYANPEIKTIKRRRDNVEWSVFMEMTILAAYFLLPHGGGRERMINEIHDLERINIVSVAEGAPRGV